jgi:hypothetical protein
MKKISFIFSAVALVLATVACDKNADNTPNTDPTATGNVKIHVGFDSKATRVDFDYTKSIGVPATTWTNNIKSLMFVLTDGAGTIRVSRDLGALTGADHNVKTLTVNDVAAGTGYTGYIIANYDQTGITPNFTPSSAMGQDINDLLFSLVQNTGYTLSPEETANAAGTKAYNAAGELFLSRVTGINVTANASTPDVVATPFVLKRAVSMVRARINNQFDNTTPGGTLVDNRTVSFGNAASELRIRKAGNTLNYAAALDGTKTVSNKVTTSVVYRKGAWLADVPAGYVKQTSPEVDSATPAVKLDVLDNDQQAFVDILIFPGGATDGAERFDVVVSGWAPAGYITQDGVTIGTGGALVHWNGTVTGTNGAVAENDILELNLELRTQGKSTVPAVTEAGNLDIKVDLLPWGTINTVVLPM